MKRVFLDSCVVFLLLDFNTCGGCATLWVLLSLANVQCFLLCFGCAEKCFPPRCFYNAVSFWTQFDGEDSGGWTLVSRCWSAGPGTWTYHVSVNSRPVYYFFNLLTQFSLSSTVNSFFNQVRPLSIILPHHTHHSIFPIAWCYYISISLQRHA